MDWWDMVKSAVILLLFLLLISIVASTANTISEHGLKVYAERVWNGK